MCYTKNCCCLLVILTVGAGLKAQEKNRLKATGNIGASTNFYSSNEPDTLYSRPSYAWNIYGSAVVKAGAFSMPVSFVMNQYDKSYTSPYVQMGASPTYKWAKLHLGYRYIPFSPLTFEGQSFRGAGIELNPKLFRFAAFYGKLNKAVNEDNSRITYKLPQYSRLGYGVKVGIGNQSSFFDVIYFHAKDDSASASFVPNSLNKYAVRAQENTVLGSSFRISVIKKIVLSGDAAVSGLTQDLSSAKIVADSAYQYKKVASFISKFLPYNASTIVSFAGQSSLSFYSRNFNSSLNYRRVQPDFKSLGTPYMVSDIELISWANNLSVLRGKLNVSTSLSGQHNNLNKNLNNELQTQVGTLNINTILSQHLNLNLNYSGYNVKQKPGKVAVNEANSIQQQISQFNINPTYNFTVATKIHLISGNVNYSTLDDKNPQTSKFANSNNLSSSLAYTLAFTNNPLSFSLNTLYSLYKQSTNSYKTYGATIGSSAQLLKTKNLNIQGTVGYFLNNYNSSNDQKNITYSLNTSYTLKKHTLSLFANYVYTPRNQINDTIEKIVDANKNIPYAVSTKNFFGGASYNYTF